MTKKIEISSKHQSQDLTSIGKTILPIAKQILGIHGLIEIELVSNWEHIVGKDLCSFSIPQKISFRKDERINGCLTVLTLSGAFAMEIKQNELKILEKINGYFGYPAVNRLKIVQTSTPDNFLMPKKNTDNVKKNLVSTTEENYIKELVSDIDNPVLRNTVERLGKAILKQNKI